MGCPCMEKSLCYTRYSIVHKLSNKQSAKMICRFDRLKIAQIKRQIAIWALEKSSAAHAFEDLAMALDTIILCIQRLAISCVGNLQSYSCERSANFEQNMASNEHVVQLENVIKSYMKTYI